MVDLIRLVLPLHGLSGLLERREREIVLAFEDGAGGCLHWVFALGICGIALIWNLSLRMMEDE